MSRSELESLLGAYIHAKEAVIDAGYADEIDWQEAVCFADITEREFLCEAAWVIFCCGMRESVVRQKFPALTEAFLGWESAQTVVANAEACRENALKIFNHKGKVDAVVTMASWISAVGYPALKRSLRRNGMGILRCLPYIGPVSECHLAKNIGLPVAKPDRHLTRVAAKAGYASVQDMCSEIGDAIGENVGVVDVVIWRYATLRPDYLDTFPSPPCAEGGDERMNESEREQKQSDTPVNDRFDVYDPATGQIISKPVAPELAKLAGGGDGEEADCEQD